MYGWRSFVSIAVVLLLSPLINATTNFSFIGTASSFFICNNYAFALRADACVHEPTLRQRRKLRGIPSAQARFGEFSALSPPPCSVFVTDNQLLLGRGLSVLCSGPNIFA